ncbi:MAG TPA: hypothetical protein VMM55_07145 [Thermohalobaculum sp.]|nr:hypothetical protein [Thermohalobaculum sp.]
MSAPHPIVALWCHPRAMSTAFERLMRERGDMTVLHESRACANAISRPTSASPPTRSADRPGAGRFMNRAPANDTSSGPCRHRPA